MKAFGSTISASRCLWEFPTTWLTPGNCNRLRAELGVASGDHDLTAGILGVDTTDGSTSVAMG
jgi:hypothetical protein